MKQWRCAIAGTGVRAINFARGILHDHPDAGALVGLYDLNPKRMAGFCDLIGHQVPCFTDMAAMVAQTKPQVLIVCTPDAAHPAVIEQAMDLGLDVICEKPLAIDEAGLRRVFAAERRHGRRIKVTFNLRYTPFAAKVKELMRDGVIGQPLSATAEWFVDKTHGLEYFRRWHAHRDRSGGLFVHKATHHFDLINWWLDAAPQAVCASGALRVYGAAGPVHGPYCRVCEHRDHCWAAMRPTGLDAADAESEAALLHKLYFNAEDVDGYRRDRCVFDPKIDIFDTMSALIRYDNGAQVAYSLNAYSPYQGFRVVFTGTAGRLEVQQISSGTLPPGETDARVIRLITSTSRKDIHLERVDVPVAQGSHDGGDVRMIRHLLATDLSDPLGQSAGAEAGALSALVGIAANQSCDRGAWVQLPSLAALQGDGVVEAAATAS